MRDLVYHTQLGRLALEETERQRREREVRALALEAMPRVVYRQREIATTAEDNGQATAAAKFLADLCLPKIEKVTITGPDGGPIQHEHTADSVIAKLAAWRDEILGEGTKTAVDALPIVGETAGDGTAGPA
jgi:hypothetical protein